MARHSTYSYSSPGGSLAFDWVTPEGAGPFPVVVLIHGGGWISGDRTMMSAEAEFWAENGWASASVEYRLAPLYPYPAAIEDLQAFFRHLDSHGAELGAKPGHIATFGHSAGGHLSLMASLAPALSGEDFTRPRATINVCGITDLRNPDDTHYDISLSFLEQFMGGSHHESPERWAAASPISHVRAGLAPVLNLHGQDDEIVPVDQARRIHKALQGAGVTSELIEYPREYHAFSLEAWTDIRARALAFANTHAG